jgi:TM2 domain-containing membrane protein YozV
VPPLFDLYKIAIEEYRFNVQMGWNRQQYYLVFNKAIPGLAATLLGQGGTIKQVFAALVFFLGIFTCFFGRYAISKSHEYYRKALYKKTLFEDQLGLLTHLPQYPYPGANLSIATTSGMHSTTQMLTDTENWLKRPERTGSIVWCFRSFLLLVALVNFGGVIVSVYLALHSPTPAASNSSAYYTHPATQK